jgi:hypothetical protein
MSSTVIAEKLSTSPSGTETCRAATESDRFEFDESVAGGAASVSRSAVLQEPN